MTQPPKKTRRSVLISRLYLQGKTRGEIAMELKCETWRVSNVLDRLKAQWTNEQKDNTKQVVGRERSRLELIIAESFAAWEKSKEAGKYDPRYLSLVMDASNRICVLSGVNRLINEKAEAEGEPLKIDFAALGVNELRILLQVKAAKEASKQSKVVDAEVVTATPAESPAITQATEGGANDESNDGNTGVDGGGTDGN